MSVIPGEEAVPIFANRQDAGRRLAEAFERRDETFDMVLGVARGGIPVGAEIARVLQLPLYVTVSNKIRSPWNPELALGAVGEDGSYLKEQRIAAMGGVDEEEFERARQQAHSELKRRVEVYGTAGEDVSGRRVIVCDDGAATGMTLRAAIQTQHNRGADYVVVALPVSSPDAASHLRAECHDAVILEEPVSFMAVGQFYRNFHPVDDDEVLGILKSFGADS